MEFDLDRLAKLAGISGEEAKPATKQESAPSALIRESASSRRRVTESKEVNQLRNIIRRETHSVMREMRAERRSLAEGDITNLQEKRSLNEAVAMGFYGPGFGGTRGSVLGGPFGSRGSWPLVESNYEEGSEDNSADDLNEAEEMLKSLSDEALEQVASKIGVTKDKLASDLKKAPDTMMPLLKRVSKEFGIEL